MGKKHPIDFHIKYLVVHMLPSAEVRTPLVTAPDDVVILEVDSEGYLYFYGEKNDTPIPLNQAISITARDKTMFWDLAIL